MKLAWASVRECHPSCWMMLDEFVGFVAVGAGVVEEFFGAFDDGALLRVCR